MAIKAVNINKSFGHFQALAEVGFEVGSGEIAGLLGPNGAGKSTLMKILCGVLPPDSGEASICGFISETNSLEAKMNIGYLPENNPLYPNMYIKEFLTFSAGFYNLRNQKKHRIDEMIELTGLNKHLKKKIGVLSKGLKQRVGIAQALLHDPKVLLLDEPTSGLDPNQIVEIRNLILTLGADKTILFSSHIMQEVEVLCKRVIILDEGRIVADDDTSTITSNLSAKNMISIEFDKKLELRIVTSLKFVKNAKRITGHKWSIEPVAGLDIRKNLMNFAIEQGLTILSLNQQSDNLERVFQELTKKH